MTKDELDKPAPAKPTDEEIVKAMWHAFNKDGRGGMGAALFAARPLLDAQARAELDELEARSLRTLLVQAGEALEQARPWVREAWGVIDDEAQTALASLDAILSTIRRATQTKEDGDV